MKKAIMEHIENDIIRNKINSLDSIPEDQADLLDSKFELLITGISGARKQKSKKRFLRKSLSKNSFYIVCEISSAFQNSLYCLSIRILHNTLSGLW